MNLDPIKLEFEKMMNRDYFSDKVHPIRKEAFSKFLETGLPTQKWEDWRFTNLSLLSKWPFRISEIQDAPTQPINLSEIELDGVANVVFYNGHFQKDVSTVPQGVDLKSGESYLEQTHWQFQSPENSPFDLLNTAFMDSGLSLIIPPNVNVEQPIRFIFISNGSEALLVSPVVHIELGESSALTFMEHHIGDTETFFQNGSAYISLGQNAQLDHIRIQSNSAETINMANLNVEQLEDSQYNFFQFADGGKLSRLNIHSDLRGEGAMCALNGLSLSNEVQQLNNHIITDHHVPHCTSSQNFKSVLQDRSSGVFVGKTIVRKDAQKTDSVQSNKNLLLSEKALMNSNPQLEIYADDVKCAHGSTTGALDEDALFYLRSRGLEVVAAKALLVRGFVNELLDTVKHESIRSYITEQFDQWLTRNTTT